MKLTLSIVLCVLSRLVFSQNPSVFEIYNQTKQKINYTDFVAQLSRYDVVLFGELHNCPVTHWLQKRVCTDLHNVHKEKLVLGAEMFEQDNQLILDEYLSGKIVEERFENEMRLWNNHQTDYQPLVSFAKEHNICFIATNIPRRYARMVKDKGLKEFETVIDSEAKKYIAPLPIPFTTKESLFHVFENMMSHKPEAAEQMAQSQAIKDATMAWFIAKEMKSKRFLHFNGNYHSDTFGIPLYLKKYAPKLKVASIVSVRQKNINALEEIEYENPDFVIVITEDFPNSY